MSLPGFARNPPGPPGPPGPPRTARPAGDRLLPQEITCESVEGPDCRFRCEGLDAFDECYARCLEDRCRDPAWWGP
ncbi:hypothetical protein [Streptomyces sp. NPDC014894]|uniref:hypothetical protein n=1 Tax=Streptomyces sp. NPDC014894 TaxID=3364931 RepID=UPI0036F5709B